jgi:hypothetical protein
MKGCRGAFFSVVWCRVPSNTCCVVGVQGVGGSNPPSPIFFSAIPDCRARPNRSRLVARIVHEGSRASFFFHFTGSRPLRDCPGTLLQKLGILPQLPAGGANEIAIRPPPLLGSAAQRTRSKFSPGRVVFHLVGQPHGVSRCLLEVIVHLVVLELAIDRVLVVPGLRAGTGGGFHSRT